METPAVAPIRVPAPEGHKIPTVAVFGASWCGAGTSLYEESERLGKALAAEGFALVNGGYLGTMEGTAKGAAEVASSTRTGVIVPTLFPHRADGNPYLNEVVKAPTLLTRIEAMVDRSDYFIIMPGTLGTLTEVCVVWNLAAIGPAAGMRPPFIIAYSNPWKPILTGIEDSLNLTAAHRNLLRFVDTHEEAIALIKADLASKIAEKASSGAAAAPQAQVAV